MTFEDWMDILRCPACASASDDSHTGADPGQFDLWADSWLICSDCQRKYPIRNRVPVLLIKEGDKHKNTPLDDLGTP